MPATESQKAAARRYYWSHRDEILLRQREQDRTDYLMRRYGMTLEDYERMYAEQAGQCAICKTVVQDERMCVDHDHATGVVRGLLCRLCNKSLGGFYDSVELLKQAIAYLER